MHHAWSRYIEAPNASGSAKENGMPCIAVTKNPISGHTIV